MVQQREFHMYCVFAEHGGQTGLLGPSAVTHSHVTLEGCFPWPNYLFTYAKGTGNRVSNGLQGVYETPQSSVHRVLLCFALLRWATHSWLASSALYTSASRVLRVRVYMSGFVLVS